MDNQIGRDVASLSDFSATPSPLPPVEIFDANNPPYGIGGALLVWFLSLLLLAFIPVFILIPYAIREGLNFADPAFLKKFAELALNDKGAVVLQVLSLLPAHLLTFGLVWALATRLGKFHFRQAIGWEWPRPFWPWLSVVLGVVLFGAGVLIAKLVGAEKPTQLEQIVNSSLAARYSIAFLAVFTAPFAEEFIYRGVLFSALQRLTGSVIAGLTTLGLFTLIHVPQYWPNFGVIAAVGFLSVALTVVRAKSGRLLPCIVIHLIFNGIQSVLLLLEPHLPGAGSVPEPAPTLAWLLGLGLF